MSFISKADIPNIYNLDVHAPTINTRHKESDVHNQSPKPPQKSQMYCKFMSV